jgi:histone deacetylase complex regulatory component SIN3
MVLQTGGVSAPQAPQYGSMTPPGQTPQAPQTPTHIGMVDDPSARKAPVEFNHAINYVNKIKVRNAVHVLWRLMLNKT